MAKIVAGQHIPSAEYNIDGAGCPYLTGPADFGGRFPTISKWTAAPRAFGKVGDVLVTVKGNGVGKINLGIDAAIGRQLMAIRPQPSQLDQVYLYHFLAQEAQSLARLGRGATVPGIGIDAIAGFRIPLPTIAEQKRISNILDKVDRLRLNRQATILDLDRLLESAFVRFFGNPITNERGWRIHKVEDVLSELRPGAKCGPFGSALKKQEYVEAGIPVWGIDNVLTNRFREAGSLFITYEKYASLQAYEVRSGDVLISRAGTVGRMCVAQPSVATSIIGTNLIRVVLDDNRLRPEYFTALFTYFGSRLTRFKANGKDDSYSFMNTATLGQSDIPVPGIEHQMAFVRFLDRMKTAELNASEALRASADLLESLRYRAFQGAL